MSPLPPIPLSPPPAAPAVAPPARAALPKRGGWILTALVCWGMCLPIQEKLAAFEEGREVLTRDPFEQLPPTDALVEFIGTNVLGGFKAIFIDYLWLRYDTLKQDERYEEAYVYCKMIIHLQPRILEVVDFLAWDVAYNLPNLMDNDEDRWKYAREGIGIYDEAIKRRPRHKLMTQRAYTFYHRLGPDPFFRQKVWEEYGRGPYEIALEGFLQAEALSEAEGVSYWKQQGLMIECSVAHAFDLVHRGRIADAQEWLVSQPMRDGKPHLEGTTHLLDRFIEYNQKPPFPAPPQVWVDRRRSLPEVKAAFALEAQHAEALKSGDFGRAAEAEDRLLTAYAALLNRYPNTINTPISVQFKGILVNSVQPLLGELGKGNPGTAAAIDGVFARADTWLKKIAAPIKDEHGHAGSDGKTSRPDISYWMEALDQFRDLKQAYLDEDRARRLVVVGEPGLAPEVARVQAKRLFERVLGTYDKLWNFAAFRQAWIDEHRQRLQKILGLK